nr:hypothetical protein CFP56_72421 [Quercus suber]
MSNCLVSLQQESRPWSLALTVAFQQATSKPTHITTSKITTNKYKSLKVLGIGASEGIAGVDRSLGERKAATVACGWHNGD